MIVNIPEHPIRTKDGEPKELWCNVHGETLIRFAFGEPGEEVIVTCPNARICNGLYLVATVCEIPPLD